MGLDISYQAMPEDCILIARSRYDPNFGGNLEFFKSNLLTPQEELDVFDEDYNDYDTHQSFVEFVSESRKVVNKYPGIENRNLYLGRRWDMLHYLLSERRRNGEEIDYLHWVEKAVFGGQVLNNATQSVIGSPICYLHPTEVYDIQKKLCEVTIEILHYYWNPQAMSKAGVYKIHSCNREDKFKYVQNDFENLKSFYTLVTEYHEGILTFMG